MKKNEINSKRILILSPHTDDGELGAGASIAKWLEEGNEIYWMAFSIARQSVPEGFPEDVLYHEFTSVVHMLGVKNYEILDFPVRRFHENRQDILEKLVEIRNHFRPELVVGPSLNDVHQDHGVIANEMVRAFKGTASVMAYELPWNQLTFNPQLFVDVNQSHAERKWQMLKNYKTQLHLRRNYFSKQYIFSHLTFRGVQVGMPLAEAFEIIRWRL